LERRQQAGRLKQWLNFLRRHYPQAQVAYDALKAENDVLVIDAWVAGLMCEPPAPSHPSFRSLSEDSNVRFTRAF
jgi:tRNA-dihydrouridine synthase C